MHEIKLDDHVLSFDGRVLESFGQIAMRMHIWQISKVDFLEKRKGGGRTMIQGSAKTLMLNVKPEDRQAVDEFLATVRSAAGLG